MKVEVLLVLFKNFVYLKSWLGSESPPGMPSVLSSAIVITLLFVLHYRSAL